MANITIRYLTSRPGRNGKKRRFWQPSKALQDAGWKIRRLSDDIETAMVEAQRYNSDLDEWYAGTRGAPTTAKAGTVEALVHMFKNGHQWKSIRPKTQVSYDYAFRIILGWAGDSPVAALSPRLVEKFYHSMAAKTPSKAATCMRVLRLLLEYARRQDMITTNPAAKLGIKSTAKKGDLWSPEQVQHMVNTADAMGLFSMGTAIFLNEWMGQRKGDLTRIPLSSYRAGGIYIRQSKTGAEAFLPVDMVPRLKFRVDEQLAWNRKSGRNSLLLLPAPNGSQWSEFWFTSKFAEVRAKAAETMPSVKPLIFMTLRHTAITRLAEAGCELPQIASISGHTFKTCQDIIDRYNIRTSEMARQAFKKRLLAEGLPLNANKGEGHA